ncbi:MAG: SDR family oxidoreductase [Clostridia bacterium]|nr:SDR family oxidoreductase [Clostridia bacterium]
MKLRNNNVIVFGGGSGIGEAIAKRFCKENAKVLIVGRTEEKLLQAKAEINSDNLFVKAFDITKVDEHISLFEYAEKTMGRVDAFVNSAAIGGAQTFGRGYEPWDITSEEWDKFTDINFKSAFFLMRNEVDYLLSKSVRGNILNIASNAACMDIIGAYGASKQAIIKWTRAFGKRFGHHGIIINGIAPGATLTPMIANYAKDVNQKYERHAIERFIRPDEIAELAFYLMSDFGEIVCGHTVVADGGDNLATL